MILFGPHAVGKMTVGQELEKLSDLKLFHNHQPIELVTPFFSYSAPEGRQLVKRIREEMFEAFASSSAPGYILTFVWAFEDPGEHAYMQSVVAPFAARGADIYWIELEAPLDLRLRRNATENRLAHKPSKRDLAFSEANMIRAHEEHRLNSVAGEIQGPHHLRIDNSDLSAEVVADRIWSFVNAVPRAPV
ncbi:MAG: AAA family ATPase [Pseudomonadota bacterium]